MNEDVKKKKTPKKSNKNQDSKTKNNNKKQSPSKKEVKPTPKKVETLKEELPVLKEEKIEEVKPVVEETIDVQEPVTEEIKEEVAVEEPTPIVEPVVEPTTIAEEKNEVKEPSKYNYRNEIEKYFKPAAIIGSILLLIIIILTIVTSPKHIYKSAIEKSFEYVEDGLDLYREYNDKAINFNGEVTYNSSEEEDLKDYKFSYDANIFPKESIYNGEIKVTKDKQTIDGSLYIQKDGSYLNSSFLENPIDITNYLDIDLDEIEDLYKESIKYLDEYEIIEKTIKEQLIDHLDSSNIEKDSIKRQIGNKNVRLKEYTYTIDEDYLEDTIKDICENLLDNNDFISAVAKVTDVDKSDVKDAIKDAKEEAKDLDLDEDIEIKIYTKGIFNKFVGYAVCYDDDEYISFFYYDENLEFNYDENSDYGTTITAYGESTKEGMEVVVKVDKEKVASFLVRELEEDKIDLDYTIYYYDKIKGTIYLTEKQSKDKVEGEYKLSVYKEEEQYGVNGKYSIEVKKSIDKMSINSAEDYEEVNYDAIRSNIKEKITDDRLQELALNVVNTIEEEALNLNYVGMREVTNKEAKKLLSNNKPTVLYVGNTYYSSYSKYYSFLEDIQTLQEEKNFHSYYLDGYDARYGDDCEYYYDEEDCDDTIIYDYLPETNCIVHDGEEITEEDLYTNCIPSYTQYEPILILINNGEVQKVLTSDNTYEEIAAALEELGFGTVAEDI